MPLHAWGSKLTNGVCLAPCLSLIHGGIEALEAEHMLALQLPYLVLHNRSSPLVLSVDRLGIGCNHCFPPHQQSLTAFKITETARRVCAASAHHWWAMKTKTVALTRRFCFVFLNVFCDFPYQVPCQFIINVGTRPLDYTFFFSQVCWCG